MAVDPRTVAPAPVSAATTISTPDVSFGNVVSATTGYYFDPAIERLRNVARYGSTPEQGFNWRDHVPERHEGYEARYIYATNPQHAADISRAIDESVSRRQVLNDAPLLYQIGAELFNPVNALAIPLGGPVAAGARFAATRAAVRGGVSAGAVEAGLNLALIQSTDPVQTYTESFVNAGSVALFGGALSGAAAIPATRRFAAQETMRQQALSIFNHVERMGRIGPVSQTAIERMAPPERRPFGRSDEVEQIHQGYAQDIVNLERELVQVGAGSGEARLINERIEQLRSEQRPYSEELFYRSLETEGVNLNDIYRPSAGGDNWFLNWVTTPVRRTMTGDYGNANNFVKGAFNRLAGDSGLQLELHRLGQTDGPSVYQRAASELGEFARANDEMIRLWAEDTGAPEVGQSILSGVDLNVTDIARRLQREGNTIEGWLEEVNRKRIFGEEMTDAQARAADTINRYFESWEQRLIETGQLRTKETTRRHMNRLEDEVSALQARLDALDAPRMRERPEIEAKIARNQELLSEL